MKNTLLMLSFFTLAAALLLTSTDLLAVGVSTDAGLNTSIANLTGILTHNLIPIILTCGCLAGAALAFMKSSPTPFIVALITTVSFGFARSWIGGTYAV